MRRAAHSEHGLCGERTQEGEAKKVGVWGCGGADLGGVWLGRGSALRELGGRGGVVCVAQRRQDAKMSGVSPTLAGTQRWAGRPKPMPAAWGSPTWAAGPRSWRLCVFARQRRVAANARGWQGRCARSGPQRRRAAGDRSRKGAKAQREERARGWGGGLSSRPTRSRHVGWVLRALTLAAVPSGALHPTRLFVALRAWGDQNPSYTFL